jgi:hypothetical protein
VETFAQLPQIRLARIFPLGGAAGSTVVLEIGGKDIDGVKQLHFDHAGLKAMLVKPNQFRVTIGKDVPVGTHEVRAVGRFGISASMLFAVSRGLTEVNEVEPNDSADRAQRVPLNCAINGNCDGNGDDYFRFPAKKGQRITIDCHAFRLDSRLRATLVLSTADGKPLARSKPYYDRTDPLLDFVAPAAGDYVVGLHDFTFAGGLPYRLIISDRPQLEIAFPPAVQAGKKVELTVLGRNLPGGQLDPQQVVHGQVLEKIKVAFEAPAAAGALQRFAFLNHPAAPALTARSLQVRPKGLGDALNPVTLLYADDPVIVEREPNDTAKTAQAISLPAVVCGRFDKPGDADWYSFSLKAGETIAIDLFGERLGIPGDPFVLVTDAKGNELASFDDHGINFNALTQFNRDPFGTFTAPAAGTYRLLVQERYRRGSPRFAYALHIGKPRPDLFPVVIHETNPDPSCPVVGRGGSAFYELCLNRRHFTGTVTIEADGLPKGVSCPAVHVSPQTEFATIVFTAAADAPDWEGAIRLKAWALIDGRRVERPVRCAQRRWPIANVNTTRVCRLTCLAVRSKAPYRLELSSTALHVAAGGTVELKASVRRHWPEFKGKVQLNGLNLPPGFSLPTMEIAVGKTEVTTKLSVAANVPPGRYSVVLRGDAQVPYNRDPKATAKPPVRVADPSTPVTVIVGPPASAKK